VTYPPGSLPVRYEPATKHTTCLVASVAMAANYLLGERRFSEEGLLLDIRQAGLNESNVADVKAYLQRHGLYLITLTGKLDEKPPTGLKYWLANRGYPVICVINREPDNPAFNHAVVVTGISANPEGVSVDNIHYFDPSSAQPLHSVEAAAFDILWGRGQYAMMIVVAPPAGAPEAPAPATRASSTTAGTGQTTTRR